MKKLNNRKIICGIDEAGRGPIAGPLVFTGVIFDYSKIDFKNSYFSNITDSKKLTPKKREELFSYIKSISLFYKIVLKTNKDIDKFGISYCIKDSILQIIKATDDFILNYMNNNYYNKDYNNNYIKDYNKKNNKNNDNNDNNDNNNGNSKNDYNKDINNNYYSPDNTIYIFDGKFKPIMKNNFFTFVKADMLIKEVSAASIISKVVRDRIMVSYSKVYKNYEFHLHKGYCTKKHIDLIHTYGYCPIHRKSFTIKNQNTLF